MFEEIIERTVTGRKEPLAAGTRKFVLNIADMPYINSTGLGGIVRAYMVVSRAGGVLCLCHPTKPITDLLSITKLLSVFAVFHSVDEALVELANIRVQATCPRCGPDSWVRLAETDEYQSCPVCAMQFKVAYFPAKPLTARVTAFRLPTYDRESVDVVVGAPSILTIRGRLDLFASEIVEQAVGLLPPHRQVVCRPGTADISPSGFNALLRLCGASKTSCCAISLAALDGSTQERWRQVGQGAVYEQDDLAIRAVGSAPQPALTVTVRRADI